MTNILIGCDPEGFIVDGQGNFISAYGIIPGDKLTPSKLEKGAVQVDGMAIEFNIDAAASEDEFNGNVVTVLHQLDELVKKIDKDFSINWTPVVHFKQTIWEMSPEQCKILGCDPDFNIKGEMNENPTLRLENNPIRTAAGHIHIGFLDELLHDPMEKTHFDTCKYIAEGFFGANLPFYVPRTTPEVERMSYYGSMGAFRPKKYGVELRSPSNLWVSEEKNRRQIYRDTRNQFNELTGL